MTAFRATYSDFKLVKTRKVVQIVLEIPVEHANAVLDVLGGMPDPVEREMGSGLLFSVPNRSQPQPVVDKPPAGAKRDWRDLQPAQQAGIRCGDAAFVAFLKESRPDDWRESERRRGMCPA
jgi:hypothetical protein